MDVQSIKMHPLEHQQLEAFVTVSPTRLIFPVTKMSFTPSSGESKKPALDSLDDLDPEMKRTLELGISRRTKKADNKVDIVNSVITSFKCNRKRNYFHMNISYNIQEHPELVKKYFNSCYIEITLHLN